VGPEVSLCERAGETANTAMRSPAAQENRAGQVLRHFGRRADSANERSEIQKFIG
jgi:hypothetical protein